jgi:hypothetical protein
MLPRLELKEKGNVACMRTHFVCDSGPTVAPESRGQSFSLLRTVEEDLTATLARMLTMTEATEFCVRESRLSIGGPRTELRT